MVASPLPSQGPTTGRKCYVTSAFSSVRNKGKKIRSGYLTPTFWGAHKRAEMLRHLHSGGSSAPSAGSKIRSGCLTSAFPGAHKRAEMLCHLCIIRGPQQRGTKSGVATSSLPSWGPKRGPQCYVTLAFSRIPNAKHGERNQKWLPHLCLLKGPKEWKNATSPLQSQQKGTKSDLATSPLRLGGPKGNSMSPLPSRGSPTPSAGSKIRSSPQQRGTISEVAVSPLPS